MKNSTSVVAVLACVQILWFACGDTGNSTSNQNATSTPSTSADSKQDVKLFTLLTPEETGVSFANNIVEDENNSFILYDYMYNGSGVAVGDINNDGLEDIYFTGNMVPNKLYLNKGDFKFEDISAKANVDGGGGWSNGVTMIDINQDGLLDLYVCRSYYHDKPSLRENLLYINNGDLTFTEKAAEYGLNDPGYSTQATFLDYDKDGDLDMYLGNHPHEWIYNLKDRLEMQMKPKKLADSDKFYRNEGNGKFTDVTKEAGILNYAFALGIVASDLNQDGWTDVYVANDYEESDWLYLNNGDGTFSNKIHQTVRHTSNFAMGADIADINNDALPDIMVLDMLAEDNYRQKTQMPSMNPEKFWAIVNFGQHWQYMRNTLQLNNGNNTFSEIGYLSGITNTDWSWAALLSDYDNDGYKDLFVTNGYRRDARNKDFQKFLSTKRGQVSPKEFMTYLEMAPSTRLSNYLFMNNQNLTFSNKTFETGVNAPSFSNGAAYADLDNDGDLDLVVNNLVDPSFVYRNNSEQLGNHYLQFDLEGKQGNNLALGAKVTLKYGDQQQYAEHTLTRGYQSSVGSTVHFGLADVQKVDEVKVEWPDGKTTVMQNVAADQTLSLKQADAGPAMADDHSKQAEQLFTEYTIKSKAEFKHQENEYDDYTKEILLPHKMSQMGPHIATGDANGDGIEDFYVGGAKGQAGQLFLQQANGNFKIPASQPWAADKGQEDVGGVFFDADQDNDLDLYVVSGGNEAGEGSSLLQDRLYLNNGKGQFSKATGALPTMRTSGGRTIPGDWDKDGDLDLLVTGRQLPGKYPKPARTYLLQNDGGKFKDVTATIAPDLEMAGMVTDAVWTDFNQDGQTDLIVVGEWMAITTFTNNNGKLENSTAQHQLAKTVGWWNRIVQGDFDKDGDMDYVAGNLGLNYKYAATEDEPFHIYCHDFDNSGSLDIVLGYFNLGSYYPVRGRQCTSEQMPEIKKHFKTYDDFGKATLQDVYGSKLNDALHYEARYFASAYIENKGNGEFKVTQLPKEAQFSMVNGLIAHDFDGDQNLDILLAGNWFVAEVETGRADASIGLLLKGDGKGGFESKWVQETGFYAPNDVRDIQLLKGAVPNTNYVIVANNNNYLQVIRHNAKPGDQMAVNEMPGM